MNKRFLLATILLAGTIVGAGMFSLPYIFSRVGILYGFFYLLFFTVIYALIHLMYARVVQIQPQGHQFFYLTHFYFKKPLADFAAWMVFLELLFVLTTYLILAPVFLRLIWPQIGSSGLFVFWLIGSLFLFSNLKGLGLAESLGVFGILAVVIMIFFVSLTKPLQASLVQPLNWPLFFLPFGPLLFSLAGRPAVTKVVAALKSGPVANQPVLIKKAVFLGTALSALIYAVFVISVLKLNPQVSAETINSLSLSAPLLIALAIAGLLALLTSYFVIVVDVKEILKLDLKVNPWLSLSVPFFTPLILYFIGFKDFLSALSFTGEVFLSLEAIFVIMLWRRAFPRHRFWWLSWPLYAVFGSALLYALIKFL